MNTRIACLMEPIGLHAEQFHHLAATGHEFGQVLAVGISERTCFGTNAFGEQSDDLRVQRVGLGEPPCGPGKISDLAWIDDCERQTGAGQSGGYGDLKSAGGLEYNQRWRQRRKSLTSCSRALPSRATAKV